MLRLKKYFTLITVCKESSETSPAHGFFYEFWLDQWIGPLIHEVFRNHNPFDLAVQFSFKRLNLRTVKHPKGFFSVKVVR